LIRISGLRKEFGGRTLLADVDLHVRPDDRLGLVGRNGTGKTTLLRILTGLEEYEAGRIVKRPGTAIGYLRQEIDPNQDHSVEQEASRALAGLEAIEAEMRELELGMAAVRDGAYRRELLEVRSGVAAARADAALLTTNLFGMIHAQAVIAPSGLPLDINATSRSICQLFQSLISVRNPATINNGIRPAIGPLANVPKPMATNASISIPGILTGDFFLPSR